MIFVPPHYLLFTSKWRKWITIPLLSFVSLPSTLFSLQTTKYTVQGGKKTKHNYTSFFLSHLKRFSMFELWSTSSFRESEFLSNPQGDLPVIYYQLFNSYEKENKQKKIKISTYYNHIVILTYTNPHRKAMTYNYIFWFCSFVVLFLVL